MPGHRVTVEWMGEEFETLADLFPSDLRAVCIGINPAPTSVAVGHYYQGNLGSRFFARLRQAGVVTGATAGFDDDAAVAAGIGFTDLVKRPTASAVELSIVEKSIGAELLREKLTRLHAPALIFSFKGAATELLGPFAGNGWLDQSFEGARVFVMPGPYESTATAAPVIASLLSGLPSGTNHP